MKVNYYILHHVIGTIELVFIVRRINALSCSALYSLGYYAEKQEVL